MKAFVDCIVLFICFPYLINCAYVRPINCGLVSAELASQLKSPITEVRRIGHHIYYKLEFEPLIKVPDVNYTNALYSTLNVGWRYMSKQNLEDGMRLSDFVHSSNNFSAILDKLAKNPSLVNYTQNKDAEYGAIRSTEDLFPLEPGNRYNIYYVTKVSKLRFLGSYEIKFTIYNADYGSDSFSCIQAYSTLSLPKKITYTISIGIMVISVLGLFTNFYIFNFSRHQETKNSLLVIASSICNSPLLNELTPDLRMLLRYLQMMFFLSALRLSYPGFLQPIMTYTNWVALIRINIFSSTITDNLGVNGIYQTLGKYGLFGVFPEDEKVSNGRINSDIWSTFMIWLLCVIAIFIILSQFYVTFKQSFLKECKVASFKSRILFSVGIIIQFLYSYFALPFIVFSSFMIYGLASNMDVIPITAILSISFLIFWLAGLSWFLLYVIIKHKDKLYSSSWILSCWSSLYYHYKPSKSNFVIVEEIKIIVQGVVIGAGQSNGTVQLSLLTFTELFYFFALLYFFPYYNRSRNIWCCSLSFLCLIAMFLSFTYIDQLDISMTIKSIIASIQLILCFATSILFLVSFIYRAVCVFIQRHKSVPVEYKKVVPTSSIDEESNEKHFSTFSFEAPDSSVSFHSMSEDGGVLSDVEQNHTFSQVFPPPVSPINDEYLARISNSEIRSLWTKRSNKRFKRLSNVSSIESTLNKFRKSVVSETSESGFSVIGRKEIVIKKNPLPYMEKPAGCQNRIPKH